jgi:hypothetical protein
MVITSTSFSDAIMGFEERNRMRTTRHVCSIAGLLAIGAAVYAAQPATQPSGSVFVGGNVARPGTYPIKGQSMDVLKAIDQAGLDSATDDYEVSIVRTLVPKKLEQITQFSSFRALKDVPKESPQLKPGDQVLLKQIKR